MNDNAPLTFVACFVALWLIGELTYRTWRNNRPANLNSARWEPRDWPRCEGAHCQLPGTFHIIWTKSGVPGHLCPGCRNTALRNRAAEDAWDNAS